MGLFNKLSRHGCWRVVGSGTIYSGLTHIRWVMENWVLGLFQVDLRVPTKVTGIITQGAKDFGRVQFVGSYKVAYSNDGERWITYQDEKQRKDKVRPTNLPPGQPSMSPFQARKAHSCCQVLTGNKRCGIINARQWELRVPECWIIHHSRERGHSGEREAQVNREAREG